MRVFVFLLILANLLFFAWARGYLGGAEPDALRSGSQLRPDQIRIVSNDQPPDEKKRASGAPDETGPASVTPPTTPVEPSDDEVCFMLSDLTQTMADSLEHLFAEKLPEFKLLRVAMPGSSTYWVHIPPFRTRREAENRVDELKRLGIKEYFIMQDGGDSYAISLGLFSTPGAAESTLAALREKGVRQARMIERPRKSFLSQIEFLGPESQTEKMLQMFRQVLPQANPGACTRNMAQ
jgi:hypothetical protein